MGYDQPEFCQQSFSACVAEAASRRRGGCGCGCPEGERPTPLSEEHVSCILCHRFSLRASKQSIKLLLIRQAPSPAVEKCLSHFPHRETEAWSEAVTCLVAHAGAQQECSNRSATFPVLALLLIAWEIPGNASCKCCAGRYQ